MFHDGHFMHRLRCFGILTLSICFVSQIKEFLQIPSDQGVVNATVISTFVGGVKLGWAFVDSCYIRQHIDLTYWGPNCTEYTKVVDPDATKFDINNLEFSTTYNVSLIIQYDLGTSQKVLTQFTTGKLTHISLILQLYAIEYYFIFCIVACFYPQLLTYCCHSKLTVLHLCVRVYGSDVINLLCFFNFLYA